MTVQNQRKIRAFLWAAAMLSLLLLGACSPTPTDDRELAYKGTHIGVSAEELNAVEARYLKNGEPEETARQHALEALAWRELLAYRAEEAGIRLTDEEFQQSADELRETVSGGKGYKEALAPILEERGVTEEEYWEQLPRDRAYRQEVLGGKLLEQLCAQFDEDNSGAEMKPDWEVYLKEYRKNAIQDERLQKVV